MSSEEEKEATIFHEHDAAKEQWVQNIGDILRKLPRYNYHERTSAEWNPTSNDYYESLEVMAIPFIVLGAVSVLIISGACLHNVCCRKPKHASRKKVIGYKFGLLVLSALIFIASGAAIISAISINENVNQVTEMAVDAEESILNDANTALYLLTNLNSTDKIPPELLNALSYFNETAEAIKNHKDEALEVVAAGEIGLILAFSVSLIVCFLSVAGVCCNGNPAMIALVLFSLLMMPLFWTIAGGALPSGTFIADMCPAVDSYIANHTNPNSQKWVNFYLYCSGENPFLNDTLEAQQQLNRTEQQLELAIETHQRQEVIQALMALVDELKRLVKALQNLSNCNTTMGVWNNTKAIICGDIFAGILLIFLGAAVIALCFLFISLMALQLRLMRKREVEYQLLVNEEVDIAMVDGIVSPSAPPPDPMVA